MNKIYLPIFILVSLNLLSHFCNGRADYVLLNRRVLEHKVSGKCLTVTEDYKIFLDTCNYEREEPLIAGIFSIVRHNLGGHLMRWRTGPIPGAIEGCLQALKPKVTDANQNEDVDEEDDEQNKVGKGELRLVACDTRDPTLNWEFERNDTYKYLLKKYPDGPCVSVGGHEVGAGVNTVPCDGYDPEQMWRICEDKHDEVKCDP